MNDYDDSVVDDDDDDDYGGNDGDNEPSIMVDISYHASSLHMTQDILKN